MSRKSEQCIATAFHLMREMGRKRKSAHGSDKIAALIVKRARRAMRYNRAAERDEYERSAG